MELKALKDVSIGDVGLIALIALGAVILAETAAVNDIVDYRKLVKDFRSTSNAPAAGSTAADAAAGK